MVPFTLSKSIFFCISGVDLEPLEEGDALLLPKPEEDAKIKTDSKIEDHYYILEELGKYVKPNASINTIFEC